jgi:hypothetical protein
VGVLKVIIYAIFPFPYLHFTNREVSAAEGGMTYKAGLKESNRVRSVGRGSELCMQNILRQDCGAAGGGGLIEAFVSVYSTSGHFTVMDGGCIQLREWFVRHVGCECFNWFIAEIGGDGLSTSPVGLV